MDSLPSHTKFLKKQLREKMAKKRLYRQPGRLSAVKAKIAEKNENISLEELNKVDKKIDSKNIHKKKQQSKINRMVGSMMKNMSKEQRESAKRSIKGMNMGISNHEIDRMLKPKGKKRKKMEKVKESKPEVKEEKKALFNIPLITEEENENYLIDVETKALIPDFKQLKTIKTFIKTQGWEKYTQEIGMSILNGEDCPNWKVDLVPIYPLNCVMKDKMSEASEKDSEFLNANTQPKHLRGVPLVNENSLYQYNDGVWRKYYTFYKQAESLQKQLYDLKKFIEGKPMPLKTMVQILKECGLYYLKGHVFTRLLPDWPVVQLMSIEVRK